MKINPRAFIFIFLAFFNFKLSAQLKVEVQVHPGTELMNVIWQLSDSRYTVKSTYRNDIEDYFKGFKTDSAVQKAKKLPYINCDFPVRLSWVFYDFPKLKISLPDTLLGYEVSFNKRQIQDYLSSCLGFFKRSNFQRFYSKEQPEYQKWIASFNRNLNESDLLAALYNFYKFTPSQKIIITLGALNCGTYVVPNVALINPKIKNTTIIMVGYGNIIGAKANDSTHADFYSPDWASQLIWHELGHVYLSKLFDQYKAQVDSLEYISKNDSLIKKRSSIMGWSMYLNENVTQAVTSYLRIETKKTDRNAELNRLAEDSFYFLSPKLIDIIQRDYILSDRYRNFKEFFPILLKKLKQEFPE